MKNSGSNLKKVTLGIHSDMKTKQEKLASLIWLFVLFHNHKVYTEKGFHLYELVHTFSFLCFSTRFYRNIITITTGE